MDIITLYQTTRNKSIALCSTLEHEDFSTQLAEFASPPKWHLAHTTWFFEEFILKAFDPNYKEFNSSFPYLFNSYYNTIGERNFRANRGLSRPAVEHIYSYRTHVDKAMMALLAIKEEEIIGLVTLGINHEQQHQELLLTDIKYNLSQNPLYPIFDNKFNLVSNKIDSQNWLQIQEGVYEIGHDDSGKFCYDNELGRHKVYLHEFEISNSLVTNGEFIEFIESGAYTNFNLWLDEGWNWINENHIKHPLYWQKIEGDWHQFTLAGMKKIQKKEALTHVNFYEAAAFAQWSACRLPTEFEWEVASSQFQWGLRWEWTNSAYLPYPGFQKAEGAVGEYNGKFMLNQMVLRGASVATSKNHSRPTYRNFFHARERWQFSGIRLAR